MEKNYFFKLLLLCLTLPLFSHAQDYEIPISPKFLALRHPKISIGVGLEGAFPAMMKSTVNPSGLDISYKNNQINDHSTYPYFALGITVDIFSENSLTGLLGGLNYSVSTTSYKEQNVATDYFSINRVEVPVYLKLRPGALANKKHLWLLLGGIFSMPVSVKRQYVVNSSTSPDGSTYTDTNVSQVSDLFLVSTSVGYEGYISKSTRGAVFISAAYSLNSQFKTDYIEYQPGILPPNPNNNGIGVGGQSVFASFPNYRSHEIRLTLGAKLFLKLTKNKVKG